MKKGLSLLLVLTMILSFIPSLTFAENYDKELEEAIIRSKKLFSIGDEYDRFNQSISLRDEDTVFYLNWSDKEDKLGYIDVTMAIDGTVLSFSKWKPTYDEPKAGLPSISEGEGLSIAEDFIKKVSPKLAGNVKYMDLSGPLNINSQEYNYSFIREENGIPYYNNSIEVYVNNKTGEIRSYYTNWEMDLKFPDIKDLISLEEAEDLYREKIGLDLIYKTTLRDRDPYIFLTYGPRYTNLGINAKDGEIIPLNEYFRLYEKSMDMAAGGASPEEGLSPSEREAVEDVAGLISQKEAERIGREILKLDKGYELRHVNLNKNWGTDDGYNWVLDFMKDKDSKTTHANISIDAKTMDIISFMKFGGEDLNKSIKYNEKESLEIAKDYIKKTIPNKYQYFEYRDNHMSFIPLEEQRSYSFGFIRKLDKAYVEQDGITIRVDSTTGEITEYRISWTNKEFPSQEDVLLKDKAYDILFDEIAIELKYVNPYRYEEGKKNKKEAILAYGLKTDKPAIIDANYGTILDSTGQPYKSSVIAIYNDIDDSYAKDKINTLAQYGIALPGEEFRPKNKMDQKSFVYLLAKANNYYGDMDESIDKLYNFLISRGIIKEEERDPAKIVTKEEAIKYIIRALGYQKVADIGEIFKDVFKDYKDISPGLKGYITIAYGLEIAQGTDGYLHPKAELRRQDGANMIYNYLFNE